MNGRSQETLDSVGLSSCTDRGSSQEKEGSCTDRGSSQEKEGSCTDRGSSREKEGSCTDRCSSQEKEASSGEEEGNGRPSAPRRSTEIHRGPDGIQHRFCKMKKNDWRMGIVLLSYYHHRSINLLVFPLNVTFFFSYFIFESNRICLSFFNFHVILNTRALFIIL